MRLRILVLLATCALAASACGGEVSEAVSGGATVPAPDGARDSDAAIDAEPSTPTPALDTSRLPIGDGRYGTSAERGSIYSCETTFGGGGAFATGDWINGDGTFDVDAKPTVDGDVAWDGSVTITLQGATRLVSSNGVPDGHTTGSFPVSPADDAYTFDRNPNRITEQSISLTLPADPIEASAPSCLPMGAIGVMTTGVVLFNGLDAAGRDAVAHEIQDHCNGHPERQGVYHYHSGSDCFDDPGTGHSALLGYALDGFGIYGPRGDDGAALSTADLDECHGHVHAIEWDGETVERYHYHLTADYPYTLGCFRGSPVRLAAVM